MQMEFLKLDKERENPLEELQSVLLSVCRCLLCVRENVPVHTYTSTTCPIHPHTPAPAPTILYMYCTGVTEMPQSHTWQPLSCQPLGVLTAHTEWLPGVVVRLS